ncbi:hypothetical protein EAI91_13275 [Lacticaseibacillus paracasei]|nr:hypothetical protein DBQ61_13395 [Lactobacillus sp. DS22_6]RYS95092.1 hypothetical protein EAI91_13275 [Lacticaseibacillus paracasei]
MLCKHHFSKNGQVFFHIFWVVTLIMQSRNRKEFLYFEFNLPENNLQVKETQHAVLDSTFG